MARVGTDSPRTVKGVKDALRHRRKRPSQLERDRREGEVAIEMVARGAAVRVHLDGLRFAERVAPMLAAQAQLAGVLFRVERNERGTPSLLVGPRRARADSGLTDANAPGILLVEDDTILAGSLARVLEAHGNHVDTVATAEAARERLETEPPPSIVLLDLNLPGESGWSLFRRGLLGMPGSPPTLVTSAEDLRPSQLREFNFAGYLPKPYSIETLIQWITRLCASPRPAEEGSAADG